MSIDRSTLTRAKELLTSYRLGVIRLALNFFITRLLYSPARLVRWPIYIRGRSRMAWGKGLTTGVGVRLDVFGCGKGKCLLIGERVQINDYVHIGAIEHVSIGNDVMIASRVFITDHNHGTFDSCDPAASPLIPPTMRPLVSKPVHIADRVWIGESVCILPGARIGEGAVIGAGAIVVSDIPSNSLAVGNPARVIRMFDPATSSWPRVAQE